MVRRRCGRLGPVAHTRPSADRERLGLVAHGRRVAREAVAYKRERARARVGTLLALTRHELAPLHHQCLQLGDFLARCRWRPPARGAFGQLSGHRRAATAPLSILERAPARELLLLAPHLQRQ